MKLHCPSCSSLVNVKGKSRYNIYVCKCGRRFRGLYASISLTDWYLKKFTPFIDGYIYANKTPCPHCNYNILLMEELDRKPVGWRGPDWCPYCNEELPTKIISDFAKPGDTSDNGEQSKVEMLSELRDFIKTDDGLLHVINEGKKFNLSPSDLTYFINCLKNNTLYDFKRGSYNWGSTKSVEELEVEKRIREKEKAREQAEIAEREAIEMDEAIELARIQEEAEEKRLRKLAKKEEKKRLAQEKEELKFFRELEVICEQVDRDDLVRKLYVESVPPHLLIKLDAICKFTVEEWNLMIEKGMIR